MIYQGQAGNQHVEGRPFEWLSPSYFLCQLGSKPESWALEKTFSHWARALSKWATNVDLEWTSLSEQEFADGLNQVLSVCRAELVQFRAVTASTSPGKESIGRAVPSKAITGHQSKAALCHKLAKSSLSTSSRAEALCWCSQWLSRKLSQSAGYNKLKCCRRNWFLVPSLARAREGNSCEFSRVFTTPSSGQQRFVVSLPDSYYICLFISFCCILCPVAKIVMVIATYLQSVFK